MISLVRKSAFWLFLAGLTCVGCHTILNLDDYKPENQPALIEITNPASETGIKADGHTSVSIIAKISDEAVASRRAVVFRTDKGFFQGSNLDSVVVTATNDFTAMASLSSVETGTATVTATIFGRKTQNNKQIVFDPALPNSISISVDSFAVARDYKDKVTLTATLKTTNGGRPSIGYPVTFDVVTDPGGASIGDFLNNIKTAATDAKGVAKISFSPTVNISSGYAKAKATTIVLKKDAKTDTDTMSETDETKFYIK